MNERHAILRVAPGFALSPGPYAAADDGTILDAASRPFCVMGSPEDDLSEQDIANGAAVLVLPRLVHLAQLVAARALTPAGGVERAREILTLAGVDPDAPIDWSVA